MTTESDEIETANATVALSEIAWHRSGMTCEVCGHGGHLRLGQRYALTLCRKHEHLVAERHPDDGRITDPWARHVGAGVLPEGYDDPAAMKGELLRMWSVGKRTCTMSRRFLRMPQAQVMYAAIDAGCGLLLEHDPDAAERGAEIAQRIAAAKDDGTRH